MNTKKIIFLGCVTILLLISFSGMSLAQSTWKSGYVTREPWLEDDVYHMEIDNIRYFFVPENVRIERQYKSTPKIWNRKSIELYEITVGQQIMVLSEAQWLHEIVIIIN